MSGMCIGMLFVWDSSCVFMNHVMLIDPLTSKRKAIMTLCISGVVLSSDVVFLNRIWAAAALTVVSFTVSQPLRTFKYFHFELHIPATNHSLRTT